jgi:hypothetical protein
MTIFFKAACTLCNLFPQNAEFLLNKQCWRKILSNFEFTSEKLLYAEFHGENDKNFTHKMKLCCNCIWHYAFESISALIVVSISWIFSSLKKSWTMLNSSNVGRTFAKSYNFCLFNVSSTKIRRFVEKNCIVWTRLKFFTLLRFCHAVLS